MLRGAGWQVALGWPGPDGFVGVWGASPVAHRGEAVARRTGATLVRIEDAFLRSLHPGRLGEAPLGILIDGKGVHFDASRPSELEELLATHPLDDAALLARARAGIARMRAGHLSKYSATRPDIEPPAPGYVLVVDQVRGDASVRASGADRARFLEMLTFARQENPGARIVLRTHPETARGLRPGHFTPADCAAGITLHDAPVSPWALLDGATAVYTVSSQLGFEAILAGHRPRVFGTPFYAGWGLSADETALPRRTRTLTRAQLFAAAMILYPRWHDSYRDRAATFEEALDAIEAQARAWREDRAGWVASGMRLWKRKPLQRFFGRTRRVVFAEPPRAAQIAEATGRRRMAWGAGSDDAVRVEDGFLRSRGLGAALVPPLSLVLDEDGIYYDPAQPSRLERLIAESHGLRDDERLRAEKVIARIRASGLSKYNLGGARPDLPAGRRVLVVGQVEDDASVRLGSPETRTNAALLERARSERPDAVLLYKPHPDVEAGLRAGRVEAPGRWADAVLAEAAIAPLLEQVDEVWTMTSLAGFEALLRGVAVTTLGAPFYAGWGLTRDLGPVPARRLAGPRPNLAGLAHATLIGYPRYLDPVTGHACPVEVALDRLESGQALPRGPALRVLSKAQGLLASRAHLWR
ncbi:capsular polysaccharide biosynthesis protein [Citreimonas sp.]|uniref:capsular polysaccharide biosynthesis protein n=1 Tax=Citreimonas sp. TaxID=3036715 RepID=UPI0035C79EED